RSGLLTELRRRFREHDWTAIAGGKRDDRTAGTRDVASLVRPAHLDVDDALAMVVDPFAGHLTGDHGGIADVVALPNLTALLDQPAVVADPVGQEVREVAVAHHSVVVCHRIANRLRPRRVPVNALGNVRDAVLVLHVERRDALTVVPRDPV